MGKSILNIGLSSSLPFVLATIPLGYDKNGLPILFDTNIDCTEWYLVDNNTGKEYPLDIAFLEFTGTQLYYSATVDLIAYLQGLGYTPTCGAYYYKLNCSGAVSYSQVFKISPFDNVPTGRAFSDGFSNGFS